MNKCWNIFKKEFNAYFVSPIAYIVISIFLLVTGWFFFTTFFIYNQADMRNFFTLLPLVFAFIVPAITMRLFSEELNTGSYEILLTMPVTFTNVVTGKFMAAVAFIISMLIPTISYPIFISFIGKLDWGPVIAGYLGAIMLGAAFSAVGIFSSSITRNQIVAFIIGAVICFALTLVERMMFFVPVGLVTPIEYLGANVHFQNVAKGVIDSRDILYFISVSFIALYGANLVIQRKN
ncbi:MAG: ABC transporter [Desulfatiglans sp.]|jgi:ABC-2 type transport system permease protein|nr:ABC transporter [Desulfatiglans sp.]